jgi:hypothetical protein
MLSSETTLEVDERGCHALGIRLAERARKQGGLAVPAGAYESKRLARARVPRQVGGLPTTVDHVLCRELAGHDERVGLRRLCHAAYLS